MIEDTQNSNSNPLTEQERRDLAAHREQSFAIAFEHVLDKVSNGDTLSDTLREYHTPLDPAQFRTWIYREPARKRAWQVAKALGAEAMEDEIRRISDGIAADGSPMPNDVARANLQITTRRWLMQVNNRRRYGDTKYIEQNTTTRTSMDVSSMSRDELRRMVLESFGIGDEVVAGASILDNDVEDL